MLWERALTKLPHGSRFWPCSVVLPAWPCLGVFLPIYIAWSTPGAALIALTAGVPLNEALAAAMFAGFLAFVLGISGLFAWMVAIPANHCRAMLAGILINFGIGIFASMQTDALMVLVMLAVYLLSKQIWPKYSLLLMLVVGAACAYFTGNLHVEGLHWQWPSWNG